MVENWKDKTTKHSTSLFQIIRSTGIVDLFKLYKRLITAKKSFKIIPQIALTSKF